MADGKFGRCTCQRPETWLSVPRSSSQCCQGGWGSIEYGTPVAGQVLGGRWKPLHYLYRRSLFADVMAACGIGGWCYVKNDQPGEAFVGQVEVVALELRPGRRRYSRHTRCKWKRVRA